MNKIDYILECLNRTIPFSLAMENDKIAAAFAARDFALFCQLLDSEF